MIPYGSQDITQSDLDAVLEVLKSDVLTQGPAVPRFEAAVASRVGARHALAVNSATSALHVACLALGLEPGDLLWTTPNTFVASANCGRYCGERSDHLDAVRSVRLGYGLAPKHLGHVLGKRLFQPVTAGTPVTWTVCEKRDCFTGRQNNG